MIPADRPEAVAGTDAPGAPDATADLDAPPNPGATSGAAPTDLAQRGPGRPGDPTSPVIAATGVSVTLNSTQILHDITFTVNHGESVALLGANGSGKSTLVKTLLGLNHLTVGTVSLFDTPLGPKVPWARVAYVPQTSPAGQGVPTSALDVVMSGLLTGKRPFLPRGAKTRAIEALDQVDLANRAHDTLADFSGGQRQRVLIARALVRRADLLIMDEPTAGVDLMTQEELADVLANLRTDHKISLLVVLHELGPFVDVTTRGIVLAHGRIVADGPAVQVYQALNAPVHLHTDHGHTEAEAHGSGHSHPAPERPRRAPRMDMQP